MDDSEGGHAPGWVPRVNDVRDVLNDISIELPLLARGDEAVGGD